jgi:hypothetical protein
MLQETSRSHSEGEGSVRFLEGPLRLRIQSLAFLALL